MKPLRIVIMAKAPVAGLVKTRLIPVLGNEGAALLARRMLMRTIDTAISADIGTVECCVTPSHSDPIWSVFKRDDVLKWSSQPEGGLGQRMSDVAERVISQGEKVILIGTDCPMLTPYHLQLAAEWLQFGDASMIPVSDGGYCLLALNHFHPSLFQEINWSTSTVAEESRTRFAALGWRLAELEELHDIDHEDDMRFVPAEMLANLHQSH